MKDSQRWINIYLVYIKLFAWKTGNEITAQYCRVQEHLWFRGRQDRVDVVVEIMSTTIIQSHKEKRKMAETKLLILAAQGRMVIFFTAGAEAETTGGGGCLGGLSCGVGRAGDTFSLEKTGFSCQLLYY